MIHRLPLLSSVLLLATYGCAQCLCAEGTSIVPQMMPTGNFPVDDEGISPDIPFAGFTFPIGGFDYTHFVVESNGVIYLTDGAGVVDPASFGVTWLGEMRGALGASPRVMAVGGDLQGIHGLGGWDVLVAQQVADWVKITWTGMRYYLGQEDFSMSVTLTSSGIVQCDYGIGGYGMPGASVLVGVSAGHAVGTGTEASRDLNAAANSGSLALIYQNEWSPFDLVGQSILLIPNGIGGFVTAIACGASSHTSYGSGCYDVGTESFYQHFSDAQIASATLTGNALMMTPTITGYTASWLPLVASAIYVAPTLGAQQLLVGNDGEVTYRPSVGIPTPSGLLTELTVQGNGIIAFGSGPVEPLTTNFIPQPARMLDGSHGGIYCWHAYNADEGGDVWVEEAMGVTYITFLDVESFPIGVANPSTFQVQFHHASGEILLVFLQIDSNNAAIFGVYPQDHVVGFTPKGASLDPGAIEFALQLPVVTMPDLYGVSISAAPAPVSTSAMGSTVTYAISGAPESVAGSGFTLGVIALSMAGPSIIDLGFLGAPGCRAYLGSVDAILPFAGLHGGQSALLALPPGIPGGTFLFSQAMVLSSGVNAAGVLTSNGIESLISIN